MTWARGEDVCALFMYRCSIHLRSAALGKSSGFPEALSLILYPMAPFFWDMNIRMMNMESWVSSSGVVSEETLQSQLKETSLRQKGVLSDFDPVYSPGFSGNKEAMMIISHL